MTLRSECHDHLPKVKSTICQSTFKFTGAKDWNELPNELWADGLSLDLLLRAKFHNFNKIFYLPEGIW